MKANIKYIISAAVIGLLSTSACKKEVFNKPPESAITIDNFYKTDAQVSASTLNLYNSVWYEYVGKPSWALCEMTGGNGRSYSSDVSDFGNLNGAVTNLNSTMIGGWGALWSVVEQANALINLMPPRAGASVTPAVLNNALGEAHFMRAMAYFHIVRIWGAVPIIENGSNFLNNFQVPPNRIQDIYTFMINDMKFAEANCTAMIRTGSVVQGHVSSGSASAMLAKLYLYMQDYPNALKYAQKVMSSGEFKLYGIDLPNKTYNDLFKTANNNNEESICQIQWAGGPYAHGNPFQGSNAANGTITGTGDGYSVMGPTIDLVKSYEGGDTRLHATIMLAGDFYPEITAANGGYTVPANINAQNTDAAIKKYVVGTPADNGGLGTAQNSANNTYLMRYAEVYLIAAEAIVGSNRISSDPQALSYLNTIRKRANLPALTVINRNHLVPNPNYDGTFNNSVPVTIIQDDILNERRHEFGIENDYWFDLCRLDGWSNGILTNQHPLATQIISQQERGTYADDRKTIYHSAVTPKATDFLLPLPISETTSNPKLLEPPVPYKF